MVEPTADPQDIKALAAILAAIETCDQGIAGSTDETYKQELYDDRYGLVLMAMSGAWVIGYPTGILWDPVNSDSEEPSGTDWPVVYIELPTGQVSWHMPPHKKPWDGHTTEAKYERIREFARQHQG